MKIIQLTILMAALYSAAFAQPAQPANPTPAKPAASGPTIAGKDSIAKAINDVPCDPKLRLEGVKQLFLGAGAKEDEIAIEKFDKDKIANVVVVKKGKTDETVVIGAHYDRTEDGCGVVDNWSGITILAHLYGTMRLLETNKTYVFAAFDREEEGLKGSREMVKAMSDPRREQICSMVNFDSFGQAYPMALANASSGKMLDLAESLAKESKLKFNSVEIPGASSDSQSFKDKKIPSITLSGLGADWMKVLHTSGDVVSAVNVDSVYLGYRFGLVYLARIEAAGCRDFK